MTMALIIAVAMNAIAYFFSDKIALMSSGAQPVTAEQFAQAIRSDGTPGRQSQIAGA